MKPKLPNLRVKNPSFRHRTIVYPFPITAAPTPCQPLVEPEVPDTEIKFKCLVSQVLSGELCRRGSSALTSLITNNATFDRHRKVKDWGLLIL